MNVAMLKDSAERNLFGEPCVFSGVDLAFVLAREMGLGKLPVAAALLLDPYLKGNLADHELRKKFGPALLSVLDGVKRISLLKIDKAPIHSENFIRLLVGLSRDIRVILIKLAESYLHLTRRKELPVAMRCSKAREAYYLYAPLAHRLGLYRIKTELEDHAMQALFPEEYKSIAAKLAETTETRNDFIARFIQPVEKALEKQGFEFEIKGRPKSVHSIWTKMKKQQVPFEEVYDILAIRIVLREICENEKADCWRVYSIVTDLYPPNPARLRDWVSAPKHSGYEALHTTVQTQQGKWVEVQIRTKRMDDNAEKGYVAHWRYKENKISGESDAWLNSLRELVENPASPGLGDEIEGRIDRIDPHIFAFTPQGDLKQLPPGSSVLDFAFNIHSDLGLRCTGGRVNGKNVPIRQVLQNGDEVEIVTTKNQKPNKDWLQFVVSTRAKQHIRKALREKEMKEAEAGREMLLRKLKNWKIPHSDDNLDRIVKIFRFKTHSDLFNAVAKGELDPLKVKEALMPSAPPEPAPEPAPAAKATSKKSEEKTEDYIYLDQNLKNINYTLASCCNPIVGDNVFGFVTVSKGISVHRVNCPNAKDLKKRYNYRIVKVKWREKVDSTAFQASIRIQGIDTIGILNTISEVISKELETNMRSVAIESNKGLFRGTIKVYVKDTKHLEMVIHRLEKIKDVLKVSRVE
jgi:GTP diphosphokinase / guanosine-3',5'-bis(diphosphate) 3'-diphosphatase